MKSEIEIKKRGHTYAQWTVGIIANSILFSYGLQAGWMSPMAKVLQSEDSPTGAPLSDSALGWVASALPISALVSVPMFSFLADRYGRKTSILIMIVPEAACWVLKLCFANTTSLIVARICCGIAAGGCYTVLPMYNKEISQDNLRALIGSLLNAFCNLGLLVMYALGAYLDYYTILYIVVALPVLSFLLMLKCPESPGYLVKSGKFQEATETLAFLRGLDNNDKTIYEEVNAMKNDNEYYKTLPTLSMTVILKDRAWRKVFLLSIILISMQAMSGNFALVSYGANILVRSGLKMDADLMTISFPAVMMLGSITSMCIVEKVGRKVLLLATCVLSAVALTCLGVALQLPVGAAPTWLVMAAILVAMFAFAAGVLPVAYIVVLELLNIQIRAKLMGYIATVGWCTASTQLATFAPVSAALGMQANFYWYAAVHLLGAAAALVLLPETRGKSIEQIENELRNK